MPCQTGLVRHSPNCEAKNLFRMAREHLPCCLGFEPADIAGMISIKLSVPFTAGKYDFVRVDHDDEIAGIRMSGESRFMFSDHDSCDDCCETAYDLIFGVNDIPLRGVWTLGFKKMRTGLLRLIRLLLQHRRLELQEPRILVNVFFALDLMYMNL